MIHTAEYHLKRAYISSEAESVKRGRVLTEEATPANPKKGA